MAFLTFLDIILSVIVDTSNLFTAFVLLPSLLSYFVLFEFNSDGGEKGFKSMGTYSYRASRLGYIVGNPHERRDALMTLPVGHWLESHCFGLLWTGLDWIGLD
jgi:hypothetical protein